MNKAILGVDMFFGDAGKGTTTDFLTRKTNSTLTVRFNGGAQAAHNIVLKDGRHHTFSQFGSGTFVPETKTYLSKYMLTNPLAMFKEEECLRKVGVSDAFSRMYIDEMSIVTTPYHRANNRLKELSRGNKMHGSCGMGISATVEDSLDRPDEILRIGDFLNKNTLSKKLKLNRLAMMDICHKLKLPRDNPLVKHEFSTFDEELVDEITSLYIDFIHKIQVVNKSNINDLFDKSETVIFEPAQGVLLDENYGFHPYTTWTTTTLKNAYDILHTLPFKGEVERYGILRTFATRHGPGPFPTEDNNLSKLLSDPHNTLNIWQKGFRCGWLDLVLLKYSFKVNGKVDYLSITHQDFLSKFDIWKVCEKYELDEREWIPEIPKSMEDQIELTKCLEKVKPVYTEYNKNDILNLISRELNTPVEIVSNGPTPEDKVII